MVVAPPDTMAGQKCIAEIGNLPGPINCITMGELLLWPDCTVVRNSYSTNFQVVRSRNNTDFKWLKVGIVPTSKWLEEGTVKNF